MTAALLMLSAACASQRGGTEPAGRDAGAEAFVERYVATLDARDDAAVRELYVRDGSFRWFTEGRLLYTSADDILAGLAAVGDGPIRTTLRDVTSRAVGPDHAWVSASFATSLTFPGDQRVEYGGAITWLLERDATAAHGWRVAAGHASSP